MPSELDFPRYPQVTETTQDGFTAEVVGSSPAAPTRSEEVSGRRTGRMVLGMSYEM